MQSMHLQIILPIIIITLVIVVILILVLIAKKIRSRERKYAPYDNEKRQQLKGKATELELTNFGE